MDPDFIHSGELYIKKMGRSVQFRPMATDDLDTVCAMEHQLFRAPWTTTMFASDLGKDYARSLVVEHEKKIIAYTVIYLYLDEMHIADIGVAPEYQHLGIGYTLLSTILEAGRRHGYTLAHLEVRKSNTAAISLYLKLGFEQVGIRKNYYEKEHEDAVLMSCLLQINPLITQTS